MFKKCAWKFCIINTNNTPIFCIGHNELEKNFGSDMAVAIHSRAIATLRKTNTNYFEYKNFKIYFAIP